MSPLHSGSDRHMSSLRTGSAVEFVVFIGGDDIVPFRRVPDETTISSEKLYAQDSHLKPGSPLFASMYQGNNLTDDYYVDNQPISWQGREFMSQSCAVSRLVETPAEIIPTSMPSGFQPDQTVHRIWSPDMTSFWMVLAFCLEPGINCYGYRC